jgi:CheY-like chemotaxis protein
MKHFSILVVDDEPQVVDILRRSAQVIFPQARFTAITSYEEATAHLEQLSGLAPKLILLDIDLHSNFTGLDLLTLLRQHPQGRLLPIMVLSSNADLCPKAYELGASSFLHKPFQYQEWKQIVSLIRLYWYDCVSIPDLWLAEGLEL